jgi:hypothetical protein
MILRTGRLAFQFDSADRNAARHARLRLPETAAKLFVLRTWKSRSRNHPSMHLLVPAEIPTEGENQFG